MLKQLLNAVDCIAIERDMMADVTICPKCGGEKFETVAEPTSQRFSSIIVRCAACGVAVGAMQTDYLPDMEFIKGALKAIGEKVGARLPPG